MDNDLPPDVARGLLDADQDKWVQEQKTAAELLEYLDSELITADLHTHFMGMGDHTFWVDQIMRKYLLSNNDRPLKSLEWYGPLCYREVPTLEIRLENAEPGGYHACYGNDNVEMKLRDGVYHAILHPTSDPFTFKVLQNHQMTRAFTLSNWGLSTHVVCDWIGTQHIDVGSKDESAKSQWLRIGLRDREWKIYTMLNWQELRPVQFSDQVVENILRSFRDKEWLNLPLSPSLCKELSRASMDAPQWNWRTALNFTTDVVFDVNAFRESMNIKTKLGEDNMVHEIIARLALSRHGDSGRYLKKYMFFNAKAQQFDYQWGITNTDLCYLMEVRSPKTELEAKATLAQIRNCFTMLNVDGSAPSNSDLVHRFRRRFTPEFYPMRFKLRDPIYEQHPYTLTLLLKSVLKSYAQSRTSYVEFSLGWNDMRTPWIYQYLVHDHVWNAIPAPATGGKMEYRFLLGISRTLVKLPIDGVLRRANSNEALDLLIKAPNTAMSHSLNHEAYSEFIPILDKLKSLFEMLNRRDERSRNLIKTTAHQDNERGLLNTVVGLDLVSEELGYPYCPFIQDKWLDFASTFKLGIRLHCGEGVIREKKGSIKRAMYAHMYIMALAIRRICARGIKCRIGHGVAFQDCIVEELNEKKKRYETVPSSRSYCIPDGTRSLTPFLALISDLLVEVNITSNSYLVQHANSSSLINAMKSWLLCTDDDGVWAPARCAHEHKLQAREYCRAISMGYIDEDGLKKAGQEYWTRFRFDHSVSRRKETLRLEDTWTCKVQHPRAYSVIALALCEVPELWKYDNLNALGLIELLHSFGYYDGFGRFATTITAILPQIMNPPQPIDNSDHKIQYFVKLLNPDGTYYGLLRSLFLGCDECLHLIWYETAIRTLCDQGTEFPVPPLMPGDPVTNNHEARRNQAIYTIDVSKDVLHWIIKQIRHILQLQEVKNNPRITHWVQSRLSLVYERGRSEMEYGPKVQRNHPHEAPRRIIEDSEYETVFEEWTRETNSDWGTIVKKSLKIKELEGLVLFDAEHFKPHYENRGRNSSFFSIIWNTQDWYIRPLPPSYSGEYAHVVSADFEEFHTTITTDDRVPLVWYNAALSIAKRLYNPTLKAKHVINQGNGDNNPHIIRIAGVGYSGSAIAVLVGLLIATELRHQEVVDKTSVSNEVIVWTYGGKQFGSKSFHNKVHDLCPYNLEITRWKSLHDTFARDENNKDELYAPPYCIEKDLVVYPIGPPTIMTWNLRPSWHYFTLMLHHLPPCMEFRDKIAKPNEMSIFFADNKKDLKSLAWSLYFPKCTLVCTHESDNNDYGPHTTKMNVASPRISPYTWKWHPQQRKRWTDLFNWAPVQTTLRLVGDLVRAIMALPNNVIISPSNTQCDIVSFITMAPNDLKDLNRAISKFTMPSTAEKLPFFMDLMNRRDSFDEEYCLLLLDFICVSADCDSRVATIYQQLDESYLTILKSFRHPENDLITNLEIMLFVLRNRDICNPFLRYILDKLDNMIDELSEPIDNNQVKSEIIQLLLCGSPKKHAEWQSKIVNATAYSAKYNKLYAEAKVGSYKSFDLALSIYFLDGRDKAQVIEATLQRLWKTTDWMIRRIKQRYFVDVRDLWKYKLDHVHETQGFLKTLSTREQIELYNHSEELRFENAEFTCIYEIMRKRIQLLSNPSGAIAIWKSAKETIDNWRALDNRKHHVLLADTVFRYIQTLDQTLSAKEKKKLSTVCHELSTTLGKFQYDSMALWVRAVLLYQLGVIEGLPKYFKEAVDIFSMLWETGMHPKDRFSVALNAACCLARIGDDVHVAKAISWIGNFFDVLEIADDMDRRVALDWLKDELESETGDLNNGLLKQVIKPWFDQTKSRFDYPSQGEQSPVYEEYESVEVNLTSEYSIVLITQN